MRLEQARARCWAEVDLGIIEDNFRAAQEMAKPGVQMIPVLKANAYGCGAQAVGRALRALGAALFAVATASEAALLKRAVPGADVLVMGMIGAAMNDFALSNGLITTLFSLEQAQSLSDAALEKGMRARVHVKLDTGLHRLGLATEGAASAISWMMGLPGLQVEGLYTHLGLHGSMEDARQFALLDGVLGQLRALGHAPALVHALDSIGLVRYPDRQYGAVRPGAWLYGVTPRGYTGKDNRLAVKFQCRVAQVREVDEGELIGYDDDHPLKRPARIATLAAGYADGFPRAGEGQVIVRGARAPVLGIACMDQMMADVTGIAGVRAGDVATLLGEGMGINEYADRSGLNRNEALARIGRRVPRIYVRGGEVVEIEDQVE